MRPLNVIIAIILGSCTSIALSLGAVLIIFLLLGDDYPRLGYEFRGLLASFLLFLGMTAISAASFYTLQKQHRARHVAQGAMWLGLAGTGWYYWP